MFYTNTALKHFSFFFQAQSEFNQQFKAVSLMMNPINMQLFFSLALLKLMRNPGYGQRCFWSKMLQIIGVQLKWLKHAPLLKACPGLKDENHQLLFHLHINRQEAPSIPTELLQIHTHSHAYPA